MNQFTITFTERSNRYEKEKYRYPLFSAPYDFTRFSDGLLRINEAAQLDRALVSFDTDLK